MGPQAAKLAAHQACVNCHAKHYKCERAKTQGNKRPRAAVKKPRVVASSVVIKRSLMVTIKSQRVCEFWKKKEEEEEEAEPKEKLHKYMQMSKERDQAEADIRNFMSKKRGA